jgi:uncharacterized membrane protein
VPRGSTPGQSLLTTPRLIVHNAGSYNGIVCGGLFWAAFGGSQCHDVARVMLLGAAAAGIFGTATLKSPATALQVLVGKAGLFMI